MKKKAHLRWSTRAKTDLRKLKERIIPEAPIAGKRFLARLREKVKDLEYFPERGWVVVEFATGKYREIVFGNYRVIRRVEGKIVLIVTVVHAAQLLSEDHLEST